MDAFSTKRKQQYATFGDFHSPTPYSKQAQRRRNIFSEQEVFRMLAPQLDPLAGRHDRRNQEEWILSERLEILILLLATTAWSRCCAPTPSHSRNQRTITQTVRSILSRNHTTKPPCPVKSTISKTATSMPAMDSSIVSSSSTNSTLLVDGMA